MFQNIKVDIIYYKTATDFEMEFNLCGCCRMRLLTDKAPDKKTLIHNLSRAVSRSRVIFVTGALFGDDGILSTVARAVSRPLEAVDEKLYGIKDCEDLKIIEGATPLVTNEGYFGGCIIESGPQAMILLSDNKSIRKYLMNNLIHPYIEELAATELRAKAERTSSEVNTPDTVVKAEIPNDVPTEMPEIPQVEPISEIAEQDAAGSAEPNETAENDTAEPIIEESFDADKAEDVRVDVTGDLFSAEPDGEVEDDIILSGGMSFESGGKRTESNEPPVSNDSDFMLERDNRADFADFPEEDIYSTDKKNTAKPKRGFNGNIVTMVLAVILLITVAVLCYCIFYVPSKSGVNASAYLRETFDALFS